VTNLPAISVRNAQRKVIVSIPELQRFSERALPLCLVEDAPTRGDLQALRKVHVILISDSRMAALHKKFMQIAGPTDVITFQHGEIFISAERARENARLFQNTLEEELRLYIVHGLLHLRGFDDTTKASSRAMHSAQARILASAHGPSA
jgi:probable rRNA maturation factor